MTQVSKSAGGRAMPGSMPQTGVTATSDQFLAGVFLFDEVLERVKAHQDDPAIQLFAEYRLDESDQGPAHHLVARPLLQRLVADESLLDGFAAALVDYLCLVASGVVPGPGANYAYSTVEDIFADAPPPDEASAAEGLFEQLMTCAPAIADKDIDTIDTLSTSQEFSGRPRRLGLLMASKGGDWFKQLAEDVEVAEPVAAALPAIAEYADRLRGLADLLELARTRASIALCNHEGFNPSTGEMRGPGSQGAVQ